MTRIRTVRTSTPSTPVIVEQAIVPALGQELEQLVPTVPAPIAELDVGARLSIRYGLALDAKGRPATSDASGNPIPLADQQRAATVLTRELGKHLTIVRAWDSYNRRAAAAAAKSLVDGFGYVPKAPSQRPYPSDQTADLDAACAATRAVTVSEPLLCSFLGLNLGRRTPAEYRRAWLGLRSDGSAWSKSDGSPATRAPSQAALIRQSLK